MAEQIEPAIAWAQNQFNGISDSARLDAELLLAFCLQKPRSYLYSWPEVILSKDVERQFKLLVAQRLLPTPLAYLLGKREFYSLEFKTSNVALIPRPETELLVDTAIQLCSQFEKAHVLELGTGTGIISIALKKHCPPIDLTTTDISADCLRLARQNAETHGIELQCIESDWYANIPAAKRFDLILSNPPYVAAGDSCLRQGDLPAEPMLALSPGESGLEAIEVIIEAAPEYLNSAGFLLLEHGFDQAEAVASLLQQTGFIDIENLHDANNLPRLTQAKYP